MSDFLDNVTSEHALPAKDIVESVEVSLTDANDGIVGVLARRTIAATKYGEKPVLEFSGVLEAVSGGLPVTVPADMHGAVWPTPAMVEVLDANQVVIGDTVALKVVALKDTGKGNPFKVPGLRVVARGDGTVAAAAPPAAAPAPVVEQASPDVAAMFAD